MKINDFEKGNETIRKVMKAEEAQLARITAERCLQLSGASRFLIPEYILIKDGQWYSGRNLSFQSSGEFPEPSESSMLFGFSIKKFVSRNGDGSIEYITPSKATSTDFSFALMALLPSSILTIFANGKVSPRHHFVMLPNTPEIARQTIFNTLLHAQLLGLEKYDELVALWGMEVNA